ncbi:MAG: tetratricopeptide repeat protein, partial [Alphaproteobacteria bacterium]
DQGLRFAYAFNHYEAVRAFRKAQAIDPKCAMCFWGEAYALGPNINLPMMPEAAQPAYLATKTAESLAGHAAPVEQALIFAMAKRYAQHPPEDRSKLDQAYANAMSGVVQQYPTDVDAKVLYAEALMDLSPWDYWEQGGTALHPRQAQLENALLAALALNPNHPGALHMYIHAVEASAHPERAELAADTLRGMMPAAGHMVHMPAHIYARVGRFKDSIAVNEDAIRADEAYFKNYSNHPALDIYGLGYYPHNIHFVLISSMLAGDFVTAREMAFKLMPLIPPEVQAQFVQLQAVASTPMLALAQIGDDRDVITLPKPDDKLPYMQAMWHYARGSIMARAGNIVDADNELAALVALQKSGALFKLPQRDLPAELLGDVAKEVLSARIAQARGDMRSAIDHLREASDDQAQLPYTEPPWWFYPVKQSLGAALLMSGRANEAIDAFQATLLDQPGNVWALYGLMRAYQKTGDKPAAALTEWHLKTDWAGGQITLDLKQM